MRRSFSRGYVALGCLALLGLLLPTASIAEQKHDVAVLADSVAIDTFWVLLSALLVMIMLAGFAMLEVGLVRGKNAGSVIAKILFNFAVSSAMFWAVGFAIAFGGFGSLIGTDGFFLRAFGDPLTAFPAMGASDAVIESKFLFQMMFGCVALAIVWGTTMERIKFGVYLIYGAIFAAVIYPVAAHWVYGGGWLQRELGMQDFAGSTAVHIVGAAGGLAVCLMLGARRGKYDEEGNPRTILGHNMPLFGLGVFILWFGWFGFNAGSTLQALDGRLAEVAMVTHLSVVFGVLGATLTNRLLTGTIDISMVGNGAIGGAVAITAGSGYVEPWTSVFIGSLGGMIVVLGIAWIDRLGIDDPVGALSAHGLAGIWGTLAVGIFGHPDLAAWAGVGATGADGEFLGGLIYSGSFEQLGVQALGATVVGAFVFTTSLAIFATIKATYGLRVSEAEEDAGLDICEHGMYGYPEQFIPASDLIGSGLPGTSTHASSVLPSNGREVAPV